MSDKKTFLERCEVCGNPATMGILQDAGENIIYLCDKCFVERDIEGEDIEEL